MIKSSVIQTIQSVATAGYQIQSEENIKGKAQIDWNALGGTISYQQGEEEYQLRFDQKQGTRFYSIFDTQGREIGSMERGQEKGSFFRSGYFYTKVVFYGRNYNIYDIGMGKEGIYYPCYEQIGMENEVQRGIAHRDAVVVDLKESYECYAEEKEHELLMILFVLYNDFWNFRRAGQVAAKSKQTEYFYTWNKKLKAKYDPSYLQKN